MNPRYYIFDLDGTLFDTSLDLAAAVNASLLHFGYPVHDVPTVVSFIGNGAANLIRRSLVVLHYFLDYYLEHCTEKTQPYQGVLDFLKQPIRASILTNKPDAPTRKILSHFGLQDRFEHVLCGDTTPARKPAPDGLLHILQMVGIAPQDALMVGDDLPDLGAAAAANVPSCALMGGFGKSIELHAANPTFSASDFAHFARLAHP